MDLIDFFTKTPLGLVLEGLIDRSILLIEPIPNDKETNIKTLAVLLDLGEEYGLSNKGIHIYSERQLELLEEAGISYKVKPY
jgi:hypothetical protein